MKNNKIKLQTSEYDKGSCYARTQIDMKIFCGEELLDLVAFYLISNILYPFKILRLSE